MARVYHRRREEWLCTNRVATLSRKPVSTRGWGIEEGAGERERETARDSEEEKRQEAREGQWCTNAVRLPLKPLKYSWRGTHTHTHTIHTRTERAFEVRTIQWDTLSVYLLSTWGFPRSTASQLSFLFCRVLYVHSRTPTLLVSLSLSLARSSRFVSGPFSVRFFGRNTRIDKALCERRLFFICALIARLFAFNYRNVSNGGLDFLNGATQPSPSPALPRLFE